MKKTFQKSFAILVSILVHVLAIAALIYLHGKTETDTRWSGGRGQELGTIYIRVSQNGTTNIADEPSPKKEIPQPVTTNKDTALKIKKAPAQPTKTQTKSQTTGQKNEAGSSIPRSQGIGNSNTPAGGIGEGLDPDGIISKEAPNTLALIRKKIVAKQTYPFAAREQGITGVVKLNFQINPDGGLAFVNVVQSSGSKLLDEAAAKAVQKAAPLPYYPQSITLSLQFLLD